MITVARCQAPRGVFRLRRVRGGHQGKVLPRPGDGRLPLLLRLQGDLKEPLDITLASILYYAGVERGAVRPVPAAAHRQGPRLQGEQAAPGVLQVGVQGGQGDSSLVAP